MKQLTENETRIVNAMAENFYKIIPHEYKTYCSLTSRISQAVLKHFGIAASLLPCQVWLAAPRQNCVVGFLGKTSIPGKWDGHVVCCVGNFIIDTALHHFHVDFGISTPAVVLTPRFLVPTQVISRVDLDEKNRLWWYLPPDSPEIDLNIPNEPQEPITRYSALLVDHLLATGAASVAASMPESRAATAHQDASLHV